MTGSPQPPPAGALSPSSLSVLLRGPFMLVTAANFTFFICFASYFLLPQYLHELGATKDQIGDIFAVFGLTAIPLTPLVGMVVDRYRRRPVFLFGALLMFASSIAFAFVDELSPVLYLLRVGQGAAFACCFTAATTLAVDLAPQDRRAQALGIFGVFTLITHGLAVTLAEYIVARTGFDGLFYIAPAWCLVAAIFFVGVPETRHGHAGGKGSPLLKILLDRAIVPGFGVGMLAGAGFGVALTFVPVLPEIIPIAHVSVFFLAYTGAAISVRILGGRLADVHGRRAVAVPSLMVLGGAIAALGIIQGERGLGLAGLLFGAGHGLLYPALNAMVVDACDLIDRGKAMALYNASFNLGVTGGAILFGRVAEAEGYATMFFAASLTVLAGLAFFLIRPPRAA